MPCTSSSTDRAGQPWASPGHPDAEGTAIRQNTLGVARALLIEITGTSPVMTSVGASISSEHALGGTPAEDIL